MSDFLSRLTGGAGNSPLGGILGSLMGGQGGGQGGGASALEGLVSRLRQGGLGPQVDSWLGTGENQPVTPEAMEQALGTDQVDRVAQASGVPRGGLPAILASVLPMLLDRLSPNGNLPRSDAEMPQPGPAQEGGIGGLLGGLLGGGSAGASGGLGGMLEGLLNPRGQGR